MDDGDANDRAHDIASVGGGYAWPRLCIWGDLDRIGLLSQADPIGVIGPVRYLTDALLYVAAPGYEAQVDQFLDRVADAQQGFGSDRQALRALIGALRAERTDPAVARWRRIEARLGCDPDQGPDEAIEALGALANHFGLEVVEEAIAARPGGDASQVLERAVSMVRAAGQRCDFSALLSAVSPMLRTPSEPPWMAAELAAQRVRAAAGIQRGPLHNKRLAELLGTTTEVFQQTASHERLAYGLRLGEQGPTGLQSITLRAKWQEGRRFELCRALGDTLWATDDILGPLAPTSTVRQKFQRAFAQSLLCPFDELQEELDTDCPDDDDIAAAARHFHVAERVVQTVLVNKQIVERGRFTDLLEAA